VQEKRPFREEWMRMPFARFDRIRAGERKVVVPVLDIGARRVLEPARLKLMRRFEKVESLAEGKD